MKKTAISAADLNGLSGEQEKTPVFTIVADNGNGTVVSQPNEETTVTPRDNETAAKAAFGEQPEPQISLKAKQEAIEELHRKNILIERIEENAKRLKAFQIELQEEPDNTDSAYWDGCTLTIVDDKRNEYKLRNPRLIDACVQFLTETFTLKKAELEAEIMWPY